MTAPDCWPKRLLSFKAEAQVWYFCGVYLHFVKASGCVSQKIQL